jgi:pyruvate-formate lyase-activating enzyme
MRIGCAAVMGFRKDYMELSIIFYGAGKYARENIGRWLSAGLNPICFADADKGKWGTSIHGCEILPLSEIQSKYPGYILYLTVSREKLLSVTNDLISTGVPRERLKCADNMEFRLGCGVLGKSVQFSHHRLLMCCAPQVWENEYYHIPFETIQDGFDTYNRHCAGLIEKFRNGMPGLCNKCPNLSVDYWETEPQINEIVFSSGFYGDLCNFSCCYCISKDRFKLEKWGRLLKPMDVLRELGRRYGNSNIRLTLANGEVTARKDCDRILSFLKTSPWEIGLITNAAIYRDSIVELSRNGKRVEMVISLDAGTPETYAKVKGVDCFDKTCDNIEKYVKAGAAVTLKYIILQGINDNCADIDGFLQIANRLRTFVSISGNQHGIDTPLSDRTLGLILRLARDCVDSGLVCSYTGDCFHERDGQKISEELSQCAETTIRK